MPFVGNTGLDDMTEATTGYVNICVDTVIPKKKIKVFPNNKPYITKVKALTNKKLALGKNDRIKMKTAKTTTTRNQQKLSLRNQYVTTKRK